VRPLLIRYLSHGYPTGYGEAGRRLIHALVDLGVRVHWVPIQFRNDDPLLPDRFVSQMKDLEPLRATAGVPDVMVVHSVPEILPSIVHHRPRGVPLVSHTVWEAPELQSHWPALLNGCEGVVVPTQWNADAFVKAGISVPIVVVPHPVSMLDSDRSDATANEWLGRDGIDVGDSFIVHSVAAWTPRKSPWLTVQAYARAFEPDDDTILVLRTDRYLGNGVPSPPGPEGRRRLTSWSVANILHRYGPNGRVHLEHEVRTGPELAALHLRSNCWLSLPHSEGWNLGAFDAAAVGTPVVTTNYGGPATYLDPQISHLVDGEHIAAPDLDGVTWVEPDIDAAVEKLRRVWSDPQSARNAAARQRESLRRLYAPSVVGRRFLDSLAYMGIG
jgi:glycosyltransferase involved in cell wall biosynthesis